MPIYMLFDGIDGDVTAGSHTGWVELQSVSWGSSRAVAISGEATNRTKSAVQVREVVVTKSRDSASGKLWREHLIPSDGKTVQIDWTTTSQSGGQVIFQTLKIMNVLVSSFSQSGSSGSTAGPPMEQISFNYTEIEGTFYEMAEEGTKTSKPFVQTYNLSKG
jgi:type VI secretion system secreted protein Hcp